MNDNTVVEVPLSNLEVRICASVPLTIDTPYIFFNEGCTNYVKISLFGGSLSQVPSAVENLRLLKVIKILLEDSYKGCHCGGEK